MVTICQQCGDRGFPEALINCYKCQTTAVHRYCLHILPATFDEDVIWNCEDCEPSIAKPSSLENLNSLVHKICDTGDLEIVQANRSVERLKKKKRKRRGVSCSLAEAEVHECKNRSRHHLELHDRENHEKDQKFSRPKELDGSSFYEEAEPVKTKTSLIADGDRKSNPESSCELHCCESDKNNEKLGRQIVADGITSFEEAELIKTRTSEVVTNDLPVTLQCSSNAHKEPNLKVHSSENKKKKFRRRKLVRKISDVEIESVRTSPLAASNTLSIQKCGSNVCPISIMEVQCNENNERDRRLIRWVGSYGAGSNEEAESVKTETSLVAARRPSNIPRQGFSTPARPIIEPIWKGNLCLRNCKYGTIEGLVAHLSTSACAKVFHEAQLLPELLCPELLPRSCAWPKSFDKWGPSDDNIALYLFPNSERDEKIYDWLVNDMISHDLAMRTVVQNAELLLFTSKLLPPRIWRFQSKFYLWGVFRGKKVLQNRALALYSPNPISFTEPKVPAYPLAWHARSPISPLSNSGSYGSGSVNSWQSVL